MNLRTKLLAVAAAAFPAIAALADTVVTAKSVVVSTADKGSAEMTLIGTTNQGQQVWASPIGEQANGTQTVWKVDGNNNLSANEAYFYPGSYTLTTGYTESFGRKLSGQADLYQFLTLQSATSANLYIPYSAKPKNDEELLICPTVTLSSSTDYTFNDGNSTLTQKVTYTATGLVDAGVDHAVLKYSYDGGLSWDSLTSSSALASYTFDVAHKYSEDKVRYRLTLYPKSQYLPVLDNTQWESAETNDIDISCDSRKKYTASSVVMKLGGQTSSDQIPYSNLGLTGKGYQVWSAKVGSSHNTSGSFWVVDGGSDISNDGNTATGSLSSNNVYKLDTSFGWSSEKKTVYDDDYTHFLKVYGQTEAYYFSWKYNDSFSGVTDFRIAAKCAVEPSSNLTPNTADDNLSQTVLCTVSNANILMLNNATVEYSCDGGTTWTASQNVTALTASTSDPCVSTCTASFNDIPVSATKIRYRVTVNTKNDYKIVCEDFSWVSRDYDATIADDKYTDVVVYKRVMSADELVAGDAYLIVNAANGKALGYQNTNTRKAEDVTLSGNKVKIAESRIATNKSKDEDKTVTEFTLGGSEGSWTFLDTSVKGQNYLCASGSGGDTYYYLTTTHENTAARQASITISEAGNATITFGGEATANTIGYNTGSHIFTCYPQENTPTNVQAVQLYRKVSSFTLTDAGYGTYYADFAFTMPSGATGYTVTMKDDNSLSLNKAYDAGATVPARTPLLVKGTKGTYKFRAISCEDTAPTDNLLHGSIAKETTYVPGATHYYKLSLGTDGKAGFYWGADNGAAFSNAAYKAYLALTVNAAESAQRGFAFDFGDETTAISAILADQSKSTVIYDLNGRRLSTLQGAQKGVYIVNGKKVTVK